MESKELQLPVLVVAKHKSIAREFACNLSGTYTIDNTQVYVETNVASPSVSVGRWLKELFQQYFTVICIYVAEQSDLSVLLPLLEVYSSHPIKILVHDPAVSVPSGSITKIPKTTEEEVVKALKAERDKLNNQLLTVFKSLDKDKSGFLDAPELVQAAKELGATLSLDQAKEAIDKMDKNGDGKISFEEFSYWWGSGRKLFGLTLKDMMLKKVKDSSFAKASEKAGAAAGKPEDMSKIASCTHFGFNKEEKPKIQLMIKAATFGPEYSEIKKTYFQQYRPGGLQVALVINCKNPATAAIQLESITSALAMLYSMINPSELVSAEELKPTIKTRGSAVVLNFAFLQEEDSERKGIIEYLHYAIPMLKIGGQLFEFKVKLATDLNAICTEDKPIVSLLAEGCSVELRVNTLRKNIDLLMTLVGSLFPKREIHMRLLIKALVFGMIDFKVKLDEKVQESMLEDFLTMSSEMKIPFRDIKDMQKDQLKEEVNDLPPFLRPIYDFIKDQLESIEIAAITDETAAVFFGVLPGLSTFLSLD